MTRCERHMRGALGSDERGTTVIEFAIVAPVLLMMLMFMFDAGYEIFARSVLTGQVQAAGRASALETSTPISRAALDAQVETAVQRLVGNGEVTFQRTAYKSYSRAQNQAEEILTGNGDAVCDPGETFDDANRNGTRDLDSGESGQGGAKDVTVYTATLTYGRLFPLPRLMNGESDVTITATTLLRNQPFDKQAEPLIGTCT